MTTTLPAIQAILERSKLSYEVMACDPELADTSRFCEHYGISPELSANAILVRSKSEPASYALCVVLATTRLDVNQTVRRKMGVRKVSFASAEETVALTGMEIGGVTPLGLPDTVTVWVDARVMDCQEIVLGGGNRSSKLKVDPAIFHQMNQAEIIEGLAKVLQA